MMTNASARSSPWTARRRREDRKDDRVYDFEFLRACTKPKLFVSGSRDQFGPAGKLEALVNSFADPKKLVRIEAGDHFFEGRLREMREAIEVWVGKLQLDKFQFVCVPTAPARPRGLSRAPRFSESAEAGFRPLLPIRRTAVPPPS